MDRGYHYWDSLNHVSKPVAFHYSDVESSLEPSRTHYLSLGESFDDWFNATEPKFREIYKLLLEEATRYLPRFLGRERVSRREAEILVGNLLVYVAMCLGRTLTQVEKFTSTVPDSILCSQDNDIFLKRPYDSAESISLIKSMHMQEVFERMALSFEFPREKQLRVILRGSEETEHKPPNSLRGRMYLAAQRLTAPLSRQNNYSITSTYLGRVKELLLQISLGQWPFLSEIRSYSSKGAHSNGKFVTLPVRPSLRDLAWFALDVCLPWTLLEGIEQTQRRSQSVGFPSKAKVFFTSNSFETDDEFKVSLVSSGSDCKYVVGQHGVGYGTSRYRDLCAERSACDLFLTWGWTHNDPRTLAVGQLKPAVSVRATRSTKTATIFLAPTQFNFQLCADTDFLNGHYLSRVLSLCRHLNELQVRTFLKPHQSSTASSVKKLKDGIEKLTFVSLVGEPLSMKESVRRGSRVVFTYESTGMIELANSGVPFFAFITDGLHLIHRQFLHNFDALRQGGMLSSEPNEAATLIAELVSSRRASETRKFLADFLRGMAHINPKQFWTVRKILANSSK